MGVDSTRPCVFPTLPSFLLKPRVVIQVSVSRNTVGTWYMPQKARGLVCAYDGPVGHCFRNTSLRHEEMTPVPVSFPDSYPEHLSSFMLCLNVELLITLYYLSKLCWAFPCPQRLLVSVLSLPLGTGVYRSVLGGCGASSKLKCSLLSSSLLSTQPGSQKMGTEVWLNSGFLLWPKTSI